VPTGLRFTLCGIRLRKCCCGCPLPSLAVPCRPLPAILASQGRLRGIIRIPGRCRYRRYHGSLGALVEYMRLGQCLRGVHHLYQQSQKLRPAHLPTLLSQNNYRSGEELMRYFCSVAQKRPALTISTRLLIAGRHRCHRWKARRQCGLIGFTGWATTAA
jgi:hypothetical protein